MDISKQHNYCCILVFNRARRANANVLRFRLGRFSSVVGTLLRKSPQQLRKSSHLEKKAISFCIYMYVYATAHYIRARSSGGPPPPPTNGCLNMGSSACIRRAERMEMELAENRESATIRSAICLSRVRGTRVKNAVTTWNVCWSLLVLFNM